MKIAILADNHSNHIALERILDSLFTMNVDHYLFLGDMVGRGPGLLQSLCHWNGIDKPKYWVNGNHEYILNGQRLSPLQRDGVDPDTSATLDLQRGMVNGHLPGFTEKDHPVKIKIIPGLNISLMHARSHDIYGVHADSYVLPWMKNLQEEMNSLVESVKKPDSIHHGHAIRFFGHTHVPTLASSSRKGEIDIKKVEPFHPYKLDPGRVWLINPGSAGCSRDLDPRAAYAVLEVPENGPPVIVFHRIEYEQGQLYEAARQIDVSFMNCYNRFFRVSETYKDAPPEWRDHFIRMKEVID